MTTPEQKRIDKQPPIKQTRCHARFNEAPFPRCELFAGHDEEHRVSTEWDEDECYDPYQETVKMVTTGLVHPSTLRAVQDVELEPASWEGQASPGACFSCGCAEQDHPCVAHDCRTFVA